MKIKPENFDSKKKRYLINFSILVVAAIIVIFVFGMLNTLIKWNIFGRVTDESKFLATQQAELINKLLDDQFDKAFTIASMVENGFFGRKKL